MTASLEGIVVVDFSQFLAGPYASLKLLDMGARVIKVENPDGGDLSRQLYLSGAKIGDDSTFFHAINRGKESVALDLKSDEGLEAARRMVAQADVTIQNFRPGVIDRLGLGFDAARALKPDIIYGSISGYGDVGAWAELPGQDLLAQARSGIMWLSGDAEQGPVPVGLPIADISAGANLAQGLLGALYRRARTGLGALVETSLLEGLVDLQFEFLTTWLNNGAVEPERGRKGSAHGYLPAPYGVFETAKGYLALAMTRIESLAAVPGLEKITMFAAQEDAPFERKDEIHQALREALRKSDAETWEKQLAERGIWCARVLDWAEAFRSEEINVSDMLPAPSNSARFGPKLVGSPIRLDGCRAPRGQAGPMLNEHETKVAREFGLEGTGG